MPKQYEHTFADLHGAPAEPTSTVVQLDSDTQQVDQTGARVAINPPPRNPDAGRADQFGDIVRPAPGEDEVDDGIDLDIEGDGLTAESADGAADGDDDLKGLSKTVRERIQRERRMRQEAEERQARTEAELAALSTKVDLQGKETEWASADERDDAKLSDLRAQKVKALEEGKTELVVDLDDKITDVKAEKRQRDADRTRLREEAKRAPVKPVAATNPKAQKWIDAHPKYNSDPLFKKAANAADQALAALGFNSQSDDYYVELSKMLAKGRFSADIDQSYLKGKPQSRGGPRGTGSTGARPGNNGVRTQGGRTTVTITAADKAMLAAMGQDVDDPQVLRAAAREKLAQAQADARQGGDR